MRLLFFTIIFQILLFADYPTLYSHDNKSFSDSLYSKIKLLDGIQKYRISYISSNDLPVSNRKIFIPPFVTEIRTTAPVYGGGSNANADAYVALGKLPDHNNLATIKDFQSYSKFELMLQGKTYHLNPSQTIQIDDDIPKSLYSVQSKLGKWLYIEMIKTEPNANFINQFGVTLLLDIPLVDTYVASKNYPADSDCDSKAERKNICYFVKNIENDIQTPQVDKPKIDENTPQSKSIKACEVGSYDFNATGGSGSYTWTSSNTYTGTINSSTGVLNYKNKAVGKFPTKIRAKDTKGTESDEFNFTLNVTKNLDLKQSADPIKINPNTPLDYNLSELIICEASGNTPEKWSYNITDSAEKNVSQGNSNRVNFTPTSEGNYTIHVNADGKKTSLKLLVTQLKMLSFNNPLDDINGTVSVKLEKDLNTFLLQGTPNKWSLLYSVSDATVSESGIFTWTNPVAGDYNLIVKAEDSTGQTASGTIKVHIDPLMIYGVPMSSILVNKPYSYTFTSLSGVGTSLQFTSSLLTQGWSFRNGTMTWTNPVAGKYEFTVFANTEGTTNTVSRDFNITVNNPIHIDKINLSDRDTNCRANDPYLMVQDDGNLSISLKDATDNLSWNIKTSPTSTINAPIKNGDLYKSSLANLTPGSDRTDYVIDVNVTSTENRSSDKKQQKVMVVVDKNYLGLLDSKAKNVTDNSSYSVRKGEKLSFKPLGFGGPTCSMTYTPNDGSVSINNNCEITFNNVASYNVKLTVKKNDECASGATNITRSFSVNVTQGNIVPVLMYLLN